MGFKSLIFFYKLLIDYLNFLFYLRILNFFNFYLFSLYSILNLYPPNNSSLVFSFSFFKSISILCNFIHYFLSYSISILNYFIIASLHSFYFLNNTTSSYITFNYSKQYLSYTYFFSIFILLLLGF